MSDLQMKESAAEIEPKPVDNTPNKIGMFYNVGVLLSRGYAVSNSEVLELARANGITVPTAPSMLNSKLASRVMSEAGVVAVTRDYMGRKIWVDNMGATKPEEIRRTEIIIGQKRKGKPSA
jgi:hypothetical protein